MDAIYGVRWNKNGKVETISFDDLSSNKISDLLNSNYTRLILVKGDSYTKEGNTFFKEYIKNLTLDEYYDSIPCK